MAVDGHVQILGNVFFDIFEAGSEIQRLLYIFHSPHFPASP